MIDFTIDKVDFQEVETKESKGARKGRDGGVRLG